MNPMFSNNGSPEQTDARRRLALAISAKGVPTDPKASFIQMAENVAQIPQQYSDGESYFASFVCPEEYMFNVFGICEKMIGENPHPEFPAFFVAEYYRGYNSLVLTGADAYLTCDGDFYQTLDKTAEVTHVWHDADNGKTNRYVVFYYMQDGYTFSNATAELCPRRVALGGRCASFIVVGENRLTDVWVLGTLEHFEGGTTGTSWNPAQVIRNYVEHASGVLYVANSIRSICLPELKRIAHPESFLTGASNIESLYIPQFDGEYTISSFGTLLPTMNKACIHIGLSKFTHVGTLIQGGCIVLNCLELILPNFVEIIRSGNDKSALLGHANSGVTSCPVRKIYAPKLVSGIIVCNQKSSYSPYYCDDLFDVTVGEYHEDLDMNMWRANSIVSNPEKLAQLNANIREHIAAKVSDRTGQTALTFTVSTNLYNNLEQATIDAFTAKNWNVAGA